MIFKNIKINGRYIIKDNDLILYNGGSGISFKMQGKSFTVYALCIPSPGYIYIIVDRQFDKKTKVLISKDSYTYTFEDDKPHLIDVVKTNECNDNALRIENLAVDGELLPFDHLYKNKVVVYGDSTVAGFGILSQSGDASIHNCDSVEDFVFSGLYEMNMDIDILSASGYGLAFSIYTCPNNIGIYDFFKNVGVHKRAEWPIKPCNLLIISLGTNDNSYIQDNPAEREERINTFKQKHKAIIDAYVEANSNTKILMVGGTLKEQNVYYLYEETYRYLRSFYKNLTMHLFDGDNSAISNHAYVTAHERMKDELKAVIKQIL